jgi:acetylornithine deacetylase or succinyl-diaminopimelate desuccinylase
MYAFMVSSLSRGGLEEFVRSVYREMLPIQAVGPDNGGEGELEKCEYLEGVVRSLGFKRCERYDARDPRAGGGLRPNLVARFYGDKPKTLWVVGHLDVVPPGDFSLWHHEPFKASFIDERVYGRGSEDDGQGILLGLCAAKSLAERELDSEVDLGVMLVSDEETGSVYGVRHLLSVGRGVIGDDDWVLVPDAGNSDGSLLEVAEKGVLWFRVQVLGVQTHGSTPEKGVNAHRLGSKLMLLIDDYLHGKYDARDELFEPPTSTFEPTKREPNVPNVNTVPGSDTFYFDCRILPNYTTSQVLGDVERLVEDFCGRNGVRCRVEVVSREDPSPPTDPNSEFAKRFTETLKRIRGTSVKPKGIGGGTVAKYFRANGIPTVVWMTCDETAHQPDEYAKIPNIVSDTQVVLGLIGANVSV